MQRAEQESAGLNGGSPMVCLISLLLLDVDLSRNKKNKQNGTNSKMLVTRSVLNKSYGCFFSTFLTFYIFEILPFAIADHMAFNLLLTY